MTVEGFCLFPAQCNGWMLDLPAFAADWRPLNAFSRNPQNIKKRTRFFSANCQTPHSGWPSVSPVTRNQINGWSNSVHPGNRVNGDLTMKDESLGSPGVQSIMGRVI